MAAPCQRISHSQSIVVRVHAVDCNLVLCLRQLSFHQADQVNILPVFKDTHGTSIVHLTLNVKILVECHTFRFYLFPL